MTDVKELLAKLTAVESGAQCGPGQPDYGGVTSWNRNPEGPEAAALIEGLQNAVASQNEDVCQALGRALGYPWFKDDQKNFPGATEADGVCVGGNVAETLAAHAATEIERLSSALRRRL